MTHQLDFFKAPEPVFEQPVFILAGNNLALVPPTPRPCGPEGAERKAARLREIEDRKAVTA